MSERLREALRRVLPTLRNPSVLGRERRASRPRTTVRTGASVPAVVVRLVLVLLCAAAGATLATGPDQWWIVLLVGAFLAVLPHAALLALGAAGLVGMLAVVGEHAWQLPVLVLLTHALLALGAVADAVSWDGRVELAVLTGELPRFLAVQAVAQAGALLALVLDGAAPVPWLAVAGVGALGVLGWAVVRDLRT